MDDPTHPWGNLHHILEGVQYAVHWCLLHHSGDTHEGVSTSIVNEWFLMNASPWEKRVTKITHWKSETRKFALQIGWTFLYDFIQCVQKITLAPTPALAALPSWMGVMFLMFASSLAPLCRCAPKCWHLAPPPSRVHGTFHSDQTGCWGIYGSGSWKLLPVQRDRWMNTIYRKYYKNYIPTSIFTYTHLWVLSLQHVESRLEAGVLIRYYDLVYIIK